MSEVASRVWREPAVFVGLLSSVALAVVNVVTGGPWDAAIIVGILLPLVEALGIRQLVYPAGEIKTRPDEPGG